MGDDEVRFPAIHPGQQALIDMFNAIFDKEGFGHYKVTVTDGHHREQVDVRAPDERQAMACGLDRVSGTWPTRGQTIWVCELNGREV